MSCSISLRLIAVALATSACFATDWKSDLKARIESTYKLCKLPTGWPVSADNSISRPGTRLVVKKQGLDGDFASDVVYGPVTLIVGGQPRPATTRLFGTMRYHNTIRPFNIGDNVYLYEVLVPNSHRITVGIISCSAHEVTKGGTTQHVLYKGRVSFDFPKSYLSTADFGAVRATIEAFLTPETQTEELSPRKISIGQTPTQVEETLGKPDKIAELGSKQMYVYKDLKVVFVDGKVVDVQ